MRLLRFRARRSGATVVECAIVFPITMLLLLGLVVGAMAIFRFQETASLARQGARYASTHGAQYRKDAGLPTGSAGTSLGTQGGLLWYQANPMVSGGTNATWSQDLCDQAIRSNLVSLNPQYLQCEVGWPPVINQFDKPDNWPGSQVTVRITYQWFPELYFIGPLNLTSTSSMPITN